MKLNKNMFAVRSTKKRIVVVLLALLVGVLFVTVYSYFSPKPLGTKLHYHSRQDFGTIPVLSDSPPTSSYYYETSMTLDEFTHYFSKATLAEQPVRDLSSWRVPFINTARGEGFTLSYFTSEQALDTIGIQTTKSIIDVPDRYYQLAKDSL